MIKFFRKIRQQMLTENKISKYLLYAIGEIVLVVIGIMIALSINNWNNNVQQGKLERKYLTEIKNNLTFDLKDLQFNIDFNESKFKSNKIILRYLNKEISYSDSLQFHFGNLIFTTRTLPNNSTYENLKSRGLEIISNDSLRQQITKLYSYVYHNIIDFEKQDDNSFQYGIFMPEVSKAIEITKVWENGNAIDEQGIFDNIQLKNALVINIKFRETMLSWYKNLKNEVENSINQIEIELKE
jgi:hypothetical protein